VADTTIEIPPSPDEGKPAAAQPTPPASDIEMPASFYLGREYDLATRTVLPHPLMYTARDLTTHGVVVGMTGSGKTGLCIDLLEEAAIDGIPCIIIDPKGDLTNLLLQFPELDPQDFLRWLNPEDARHKGVTLEEHARQLAETWRTGLAEWGQLPERIARLRDSSEWRIYTPGSEAGLSLSILQTFAAPKGTVAREALNQKIDATATALLGLTGINADPVQSREHILIAQLLLHAWSAGRDLGLTQLIEQIQVPPLNKIGAFDVDTFYPEKDRLKLAVSLNNILAAPSFSTWITGEALDLSQMLYAGKKPRQLIFHIAHLEDAQRMFFLTMLLEEVLSWTRKQSGTTSLRAIVYFDEVFGYLPPHPANPPTKVPLMTLLKQARAFGVGILLATQNPVDLDYKALSNAGTWFVGKLQTDNDKARLIEGLEGVAAEHGTLTNRAYLETVISALGNRVFLLHNIHQSKPVLFQTRWALSFLRGPLTRDQVAMLVDERGMRRTAESAPQSAAVPQAIPICPQCHSELKTDGGDRCHACGASVRSTPPRVQDAQFKESLRQATADPTHVSVVVQARPELPAGVAQFYLPRTVPLEAAKQALAEVTGCCVLYQPFLLGCAEVSFMHKRKCPEPRRRSYRLLAEPAAAGQAPNWQTAESTSAVPTAAPEADARWGTVSEAWNTPRKLKTLERTFTEFVYSTARLSLAVNDALDLVGAPGEEPEAFRERCQAAALREAEKALAAETPRYRAKFDALHAPFPGTPQSDAAGAAKAADSWFDFHWVPLLSNVFSAKATGPAPPPAKNQPKVDKLQAEWQAKVAAICEKWKRVGGEQSDLILTPRKADVRVTHFGLAWVPFWRVETVSAGVKLVPAYQSTAGDRNAHPISGLTE
jgi:uncharacterized protein DUF87